MKLRTHLVEKPWGRTDVPSTFGDTGGRNIGEVWFEGPADAPLLAKYIFTSEKLSIQNHPSDEQARDRGLVRGKEECWYVLDAEPGAAIGLGLRHEVGREELRQAALDGTIQELVDWIPVEAGDFFYVPAGTVHAIGAGISLLEFQQNADVTYRLYDYGRPRELHLDEGIAVAIAGRYHDQRARKVPWDAPTLLVDGPHFSLVQAVEGRLPSPIPAASRRWCMPLSGTAQAGGSQVGPGECLLVEPGREVELGSGRVLIGLEGSLQPRA